MRELSAVALAKFSESGIEPVLLVKIFWRNGTGIIYSDRKFEDFGYEGKLISIGTLDDVVSIDNSSSTTQVSIVLDDTDGTIKTIFNTTDIHKTKVKIFQWCPDLPPSEAFPIFTGQISSPIEWKEGDRTLSFDAVTQIEDVEVGFSVEDGKFKIFPPKLIGKAWPIVFGFVEGVPALSIIEAPSGITGEGIAVVDDTVWQKELDDLDTQREQAITNSRNAYLNGVGEALTAARYKGEQSGGFTSTWTISDDPQAAVSHDIAASNYFAQSSAYADDANNISLQINLKDQLRAEQKSYDKGVFRVDTVNMPSNTLLQFKLGSATYYGIYDNGYFHVTDRKFPEDFNHKTYVNTIDHGETANGIRTSDIYGNGPQPVEFGQKFLWVDAGTEIHVENFPLTFVVSVTVVQVLGVFAYKRKVRVPLPTNYYTVSYQQFGNTTCTLVTLDSPLTAKTIFNGVNTIPEGWDNDQIEVDASSLVGPNTIDILTWVITLFTVFKLDPVSFSAVKTLLDPYPMNFALLDKKNVVAFMHEIAYQACCSVWLNDDTFFIRYLPKKPTPTDTITDDDIIVNSLSITCNDTENLITSYTAIWKPNLFQTEDFKVIYKYNIPQYGFKEGSYNFYAYTQEPLVQKSAEFWLIRNANTFKILKFKTALHKISIETFDAITIDLEPGLIADGPIVGTVLKATYNTSDNTIDIEVWLPVRFGEMIVYKFAEPFDESTVYPIINDPNIHSDNPFELAGIFPQEQFVIEQHTPVTHYLGIVRNSAGRYLPANGLAPLQDTETVAGLPGNPARIGDIQNTNNYLKYKVNPITSTIITDPVNASFPGIVQNVIDQEAQIYNVAVWFSGFANPQQTVKVTQLLINSQDTIKVGTPATVHRLVWRRTVDGLMDTTLWMQVPIWVSAIADEDGGNFGGGGDIDTGDFGTDGEEDTGSGDDTDITDEGAGNFGGGGGDLDSGDFGGGGDF
jgi:hypothetical protein